jgi:uncharacterized glyoxalase superfamily protein PhnB
MPKVKPIPDGFHTVTPHLVIKGASKAIEFYKKAFGAEEISRMPGPDGKLMHASIRIGDSILMLADEFPDMGAEGPEAFGGSPVKIHLYVEDVDAFVKNATKAGAKVTMPVQDQFWGDRYGKLEDPFGHQWSVGTHKEDLTPAQVMENAKAMFTSAAKGK